MLLSVFTPTHDPAGLADVWRCLLAQTWTDWEWVVVPNGPAAADAAARVGRMAAGDPRVRVVPAPPDVRGVGALKRFACGHCRGDVFVEYDHDDLITDDCLAAVAEAVGRCPPATFVYSDCVTVDPEGRSCLFAADYGWRYYDWDYGGRRYTVNAHPDVGPRALAEILYTPDHVRAWTRRAYEDSGGHDPGLPVGDDHDLVVRTYLSGAHFEHVRRPLYFHRLTPASTSRVRVEEIGRVSRQNRDRYLHALVAEWCRRRGLPRFDLGGAHSCPPGYVPVDRALPEGHPGRGDVFEVLGRLDDDSVGCFRAFDFLEHVPADRVVGLFNLVYRKLVPGGFFLSHTPAVCDDEGRCGRGAYQDPDHKSFWSSNNFWYFTDRAYAAYLNGAVACRFQTVRVGNHYPSDHHRLHLIPYVFWDGMALKRDDEHYFPGPKRI